MPDGCSFYSNKDVMRSISIKCLPGWLKLGSKVWLSTPLLVQTIFLYKLSLSLEYMYIQLTIRPAFISNESKIPKPSLSRGFMIDLHSKRCIFLCSPESHQRNLLIRLWIILRTLIHKILTNREFIVIELSTDLIKVFLSLERVMSFQHKKLGPEHINHMDPPSVVNNLTSLSKTQIDNL